MNQAAEAYPLYWPMGRPRTARRSKSSFKPPSFGRVRDELINELHLMQARKVILSTNIPLRRDGLPYASQGRIDDPGVAVYFQYKNREVCFACDRWVSVEENMQAIRHTINALRGIARWGTGDMVDAAFRGFEALPAPKTEWRHVLELPATAKLADAEEAYKVLALKYHPDRGGSEEIMANLNAAIAQARQEQRHDV